MWNVLGEIYVQQLSLGESDLQFHGDCTSRPSNKRLFAPIQSHIMKKFMKKIYIYIKICTEIIDIRSQ